MLIEHIRIYVRTELLLEGRQTADAEDAEGGWHVRWRSWLEDVPRWRAWAVARSSLQKSYSPSPDAGSQKRPVPETCSPVRRYTLALGIEKATVAVQQRGSKTLVRLNLFLVEVNGCIYSETNTTLCRNCDLNWLYFQILQTSSPSQQKIKLQRKSCLVRCGVSVWCFSFTPHHIVWKSGDKLHIYVGYSTPPLIKWD